MDDPLAELAEFEQRLRVSEDPFADIDDFLKTKPAASTDLEDLFADLEKSASSLTTVITGFFTEEFELVVENLSPDDTLGKLGLGEEHIKALGEFLSKNVDAKFVALDCGRFDDKTTFSELCAAVDAVARQEKVEIDVDKLLEPLTTEPKEKEEEKANSLTFTPKTRRRNAVQKGIR